MTWNIQKQTNTKSFDAVQSVLTLCNEQWNNTDRNVYKSKSTCFKLVCFEANQCFKSFSQALKQRTKLCTKTTILSMHFHRRSSKLTHQCFLLRVLPFWATSHLLIEYMKTFKGQLCDIKLLLMESTPALLLFCCSTRCPMLLTVYHLWCQRDPEQVHVQGDYMQCSSMAVNSRHVNRNVYY